MFTFSMSLIFETRILGPYRPHRYFNTLQELVCFDHKTSLIAQKYQPCGKGGTRSPHTMPPQLQHCTACKIQNGWLGLEKDLPLVLGCSCLLSTFAKYVFWSNSSLYEKHWWQRKERKKNKLGLSWAKLSSQLGFVCTVINICCCILIYLKWLDT